MAMGIKHSFNISNEFYCKDPNFTIGSLLHLFCILKKEPIGESWFLFEFEPKNAFFQQILQGSSCCLNALKHVDKIVAVKPLPRKLLLHMDNCVKYNKNHHLLPFLSLLTT